MDEKNEPTQGAPQDAQGETKAPAGDAGKTPETAPAVDVEAIRAEAKSAARDDILKEFGATLKELTGVESLDALREKALAEQGQYQKLAEEKEAKIADLESQLLRERAQNALATEAAKHGVMDLDVLNALALDRARIDGDALTINGEPVGEYVARIAQEKPHLVASSGGPGGGTPSDNSSGEVNPWKPGSINLTQQGQILKTDPQRAARLQAEAGNK